MTNELLTGAAPGVTGRVSKTGWSNSALFQDFMQNHLVKFVNTNNSSKILLLYDGHKSHVCVPLIEWARQHNIILFVLPPHTSHALQPLDVGVFGPFKNAFYQLCFKFMRKNPGKVISRYDLCSLVCEAHHLALTAKNLIGAFRKSGICPFDYSAISEDHCYPIPHIFKI